VAATAQLVTYSAAQFVHNIATNNRRQRRQVPGGGRIAYGKHDDIVLALSIACWHAERTGGDYGSKIEWF